MAPVDKPASRETGPAREDNGKAEAFRLDQKEDGSVGSAEVGVGSSSMEDGLLAFARSFGEGVEGVPEVERRLASWLGERSIEELADLDAYMLRRVAVSAGLDKGKAWALRMAIDRATPKNRLREVFEERSRRKRRDAEDGSVGIAEDGSIPFHRGGDGEADRVAYEAAKGLLEAAGVPVVEVGDAEAKEVVRNKKTSLDTGKANHEGAEVPAISSDDVAKIQQNLEDKVEKYENISNRSSRQNASRTLRGDISEALGIPERGQSSRYVNVESKNGHRFTLRISNHNGKVSNFDANGETEGISIVISRDINRGVVNDGDAHVVEFFYSDKRLAQADENAYVQILRGLQQLLYSGEYKDTTGLAQTQEVNGAQATKFMIEAGASGGENEEGRLLKDSGGVVYGWTVGGKVYLNRDAMNPETPLHEYTHLWDEMVRRENPELWERGKELMRETPLWDEVMNDPDYADIRGDEDAVASEVHSRLTGKRGKERIKQMMDEAKGAGRCRARYRYAGP